MLRCNIFQKKLLQVQKKNLYLHAKKDKKKKCDKAALFLILTNKQHINTHFGFRQNFGTLSVSTEGVFSIFCTTRKALVRIDGFKPKYHNAKLRQKF